MACCGLCRPKVKPTQKTNKNITMKKINTIDMWIENIEGPYEPIDLPFKPSDQPKTITNKEEIAEAQTNHHLSDISISTDQDKTSQYSNTVFNQNMKSLSSELSINDE
jgi:hypothetical protein